MSRRFQFSLKWLFVAMLVVATYFGALVTPGLGEWSPAIAVIGTMIFLVFRNDL
jgi:hypothetical protein